MERSSERSVALEKKTMLKNIHYICFGKYHVLARSVDFCGTGRCANSRLDESLACRPKPRLANQSPVIFAALSRPLFFHSRLARGRHTGRSLASRQRACVRGEMNENWRREKRGSEREKEDGAWFMTSIRCAAAPQFARDDEFRG